MKVELTLQKSIRGKKYYLILDNVFIIRISKKTYQMLSVFYDWLQQKDIQGYVEEKEDNDER